MIARAASISVGLLYNYFPSKADLLGALFEESMRDVQASFASAEAASTPAERNRTVGAKLVRDPGRESGTSGE
jgi:AcrR family transcriptional regulator